MRWQPAKSSLVSLVSCFPTLILATILAPLLISACGSDSQQAGRADQNTGGLFLRGQAERAGDGGSTSVPVPEQTISAQILLIAQARSTATGDACPAETQHRASVKIPVAADSRFEVRIPWSDFLPVSHPQCPLAAVNTVNVQALRTTGLVETDGAQFRADARASEEDLKRSSADGAADATLEMKLLFNERLPAASSEDAQPDLVIDTVAAKESWSVVSRTFTPGSCALQEGCVGGLGVRRLLTFDGAMTNQGNAPVVVGDPGNWQDAHYDACHQHYHLAHTMSYELRSADGSVVVEGRKQGFCLMDTSQTRLGSPGVFTCANQGLSPGWTDVYDRSLDCQWIDVTDVPSGDYQLRLTANPEFAFPEGDYGNNSADIAVRIEAAQ